MHQRASSTAILILSATLVACGGGGSSSNSGGDTPIDPPPTDPPPVDPPAPTGSRMSAINYDLDNNGTVDGTATILYDTNGRPSDFLYIYSGDGTPDTSAGIIGLRGDEEDTLSFSYDANGRLEQQIQDMPSASTITRLVFNFEWDANDLVTRNVNDFFDSSGGLSEIRYDRDNDGAVDVVERPVWEDSACDNILNWFGFSGEEPLLSTASPPYLNGTGYGLITFCENAGHVQ